MHPDTAAAARALGPIDERQVARPQHPAVRRRRPRSELAALGECARPASPTCSSPSCSGREGADRGSGLNSSAADVIARPASPLRPRTGPCGARSWENRSIYLAPLAVAALILVGFSDRRSSACRQAARRVGARPDAAAQAAIEQPYMFAALMLMLIDLPRRGLLLPRRALRRAARSQHPVLEVAAGLRSHDGAGQGEHPDRRPSAGDLRGHRGHAVVMLLVSSAGLVGTG